MRRDVKGRWAEQGRAVFIVVEKSSGARLHALFPIRGLLNPGGADRTTEITKFYCKY